MSHAGSKGLLLDSNVVLFWLIEPEVLREVAISAIRQPRQFLAVSVATVWELEIKKASGRLSYPDDLWSTLDSWIDRLLPLDRPDALAAARLPHHHGDPFDRIIIAQAVRQELTVVTRDAKFELYDVPVMRA